MDHKLVKFSTICSAIILILLFSKISADKTDNEIEDDMTYVLREGKVNFTITYKKVASAVANKHLKVWSAKKQNQKTGNIKYKLLDGLMDKIGDFAFYQDSTHFSAVVKFPKYDKLLGVFKDTYIIDVPPSEKLWYNASKKHHVTYPGDPNLKLWTNSIDLPCSTPEQKIECDLAAFQSFLKSAFGDGERRHRRNALPQEIFPEILVIVSNEFAKSLQLTNMSDHEAVVLHTISYFNAIDMLYSPLQKIKIHINIAGIIIEDEPDVLPMKRLQMRSPVAYKETRKVYSSTESIITLGKYFYQIENQFPRNTYDYIYYMARSVLFNVRGNYFEKGIAGSTPLIQEDIYVEDYARRVLPIALVDNYNMIRDFSAATHEITHLMQVQHDDTHDNHHGRGIMIPDESHGRLKWSNQSRIQLKKYFQNRNHCYLLNKPHSLSNGPSLSMTPNDLCICYGFVDGLEDYTDEELLEICDEVLDCKTNEQIKLHTYDLMPVPLDGTRCGPNKVCWSESCVDITEFK